MNVYIRSCKNCGALLRSYNKKPHEVRVGRPPTRTVCAKCYARQRYLRQHPSSRRLGKWANEYRRSMLLITSPTGVRYTVLIDVKSQERLRLFSWRLDDSGRVVSRLPMTLGGPRTIRIHQVVLPAKRGFEIDHINRNKLDNRRKNLRYCTHHQNMRNVGSRQSRSGYRGVLAVKRPNGRIDYRAVVNFGLGTFTVAESAARAYNVAARKLFGRFAVLNVIRKSK